MTAFIRTRISECQQNMYRAREHRLFKLEYFRSIPPARSRVQIKESGLAGVCDKLAICCMLASSRPGGRLIGFSPPHFPTVFCLGASACSLIQNAPIENYM